MSKWWKRSLALSLGLLAGGARAADPVPAVQFGQPVSATSAGAPAAASLQRPVPLSASTQSALPAVDPALRPIAFSNESDTAAAVIRAQAPDTTSPKPMPAGPADAPVAASSAANPPPSTFWRRNPGTAAAPGSPTETITAPATAGTVVASAGQSTTASGAPAANGTVPAPAIAGPVVSLLHSCGICCDSCNACASGNDCGSCNACGGNDYGDCGCSFGNRFYVSAEYLLWWIKSSNTPPLVTRGSAGDPIPGALGFPGTTVLFGGAGVEDNPFSGGRLTLGYWFGDEHLLGIDLGGFFLGQQGKNFSATSMGNPILARPIIDAATGMETTELVAGPGVLAGTVSVNTESKMWGYEANLRSNLCAGQIWCTDYFVDGIIGYRGLGLDERLNVNESLVVIGGSSAGQQFAVNDSFGTQNRFYGAQIGFLSEFRRGNWVLDLNAKVALGETQEMVRINGMTTITAPGGSPQTFAGGLLALPSNIGRFNRDIFTWVPEVGLNLGYQWNDHWKFFVGYNFLYWSDVVRPGNQIDRVVNVNQLPPPVPGGPARPQFVYNPSDFWVQGVTFGVEYKY